MPQNDDLSLGAGLIKKGEARGVSPALAVSPGRPETVLQPASLPPEPIEEDEPPLRAVPPDDVPKRFTSFRLPVSLDEDLRAMMFETRRSKQDLLIEFVTAGVKTWRQNRAKRG
jgi:hypothetical protein